MDLIQMARNMGKELQAGKEYQRLKAAQKANDEDEKLQQLIQEFNLKRLQLSAAMQKDPQDKEEMAKLDKELRDVYAEVMGNSNMLEYNEARQGIDQLMEGVNGILSRCVNGEDPDTCSATSCTGNCQSCGGCH